FTEDGREVYDWTALLRLKEDAARRLRYDWYLHVDADEIRYSPWPGVSLCEGLDRVDSAGYNLVNFKLFNFRLTADTVIGNDFEASMTAYSATERFNQRQVKAWKASDAVDIASLGGHHVRVPDARVFPTRFIHKHYPVRSLEHGRRKIMAERKARFSQAERRRGWHVQYDSLEQVDAKDVFWDAAQLQVFDHARECQLLLAESNAVLMQLLSDVSSGMPRLGAGTFVAQWLERMRRGGVEDAHAQRLVIVADRLSQALAQQDLPPVAADPMDADWIRRIVSSLACMRFLDGEPLLQGRLPMLRIG
ncbi:MAG TPA: hypothetical protein VFP68_20660, partial [Burkholderiaceae bacterium]|nr:hypothetical protein [Burkholderiaceae bacterium]